MCIPSLDLATKLYSDIYLHYFNLSGPFKSLNYEHMPNKTNWGR